IEFGNMKSEKPKLLSTANYLKAQDNTSAQYASQFVAMMRLLKTVGVKNLSEADNQLLYSVEEPTEQAMTAYFNSKKAATEKADARSNRSAKWIADEQARKLEEARLEEEKRQAQAAAQQEQEKIDAMHRQAAAQERQAAAQSAMAQQMAVHNNLDARMNRYY